jgi:hypothetical protein
LNRRQADLDDQPLCVGGLVEPSIERLLLGTPICLSVIADATCDRGDAFTVGSFVAGGALLAAFASTELRAETPITPLRLLADTSRTSAVVARGLLFAALFGLFFFLTQYLQDVLHYSPPADRVRISPASGHGVRDVAAHEQGPRTHGQRKGPHARRHHFRRAGFQLLTTLTPGSHYPTVIGSLLLVAVGNGLSIVPLTSAAIDRVAPGDAGAASGLVNVTQQLGGTLGVAILVTVFGSATTGADRLASGGPAAQAAHDFTVGATSAFLAACVFLVAALALVAVAVQAPRPRAAD